MFNFNPGMSHLDYIRLLPAVYAPTAKSLSVPPLEEKMAVSDSQSLWKPSSTSRKELAEYKKTLILSDIQKETAVGILLGDGSLQSNQSKDTWRLKFCYGEKHRDYANHLYDVFSPWCLSKPVLAKNRNTVSFQTLSHEKLKVLSDIFLLDKGPKGISPTLVDNYLTRRGLAYWFMDDGGKLDYSSNEGKGIVFNTQCFKKDEVELLAQGLAKKFDLQTWVKPNKKGYVVGVSGKSYETFLEHVNPFLHESMKYKLPTPRKSRVNIFILKEQQMGTLSKLSGAEIAKASQTNVDNGNI